MNIAFLVEQFPALSETFILKQITGLLDRGHEVDIFAYGPRNDPDVHADVTRYHLLKRTYYMTTYTSMPKNKVYRLMKGIGRIALDFPKKPLVVVNSLNFLEFGKDAAALEILYQLDPFLNKGPYDIVHCHFGPLGQLAVRLKTVGAIKGHVITTFRGYDISSYVRRKGDHIYNNLFEQGTLFLCVSEQIKSTLMKLGCAEQKIIVHRSGVDIKQSSSRSPRTRTNGKVRLLTIARLIEKKGVQYGIEAVAKLLNKYPQIDYKIAGDGYLKDPLQSFIEDLKVADHVHLLGWQRQEQIRALLQEADILLAPSVTSRNGDREGIPGAVIEALAWGLPVLSTQHSGIPEVIQDGESGFLVAERDADALAEKLDYLITHPELWLEMGRKGQKYVAVNYNIDTLNDRLVAIYQQLLSGASTQ